MQIEVRYCSKTGNTKKVANAIAASVGVSAKSVKEPVVEADLLFLGGALYADQINSKLKKFISKLDNKKIKKVIVFCTSTSGKNIYLELKDLLEVREIKVHDEYFHCLGNFIFYLRKRPNQKDLALAQAFAKRIVNKEKQS